MFRRFAYGSMSMVAFTAVVHHQQQQPESDDDDDDDNNTISSLSPIYTSLPCSSIHIHAKAYVGEYDFRTRIPKYIIETITKDSVDGDADRKTSRFHNDVNIPDLYNATLQDYRNSGYSRGHLASAGAHKGSQESMDSTFSLSNIVPQDMSMNGCDWYRLELLSRRLAKQFDYVYVMNGPLFLPQENEETGEKFVKYRVIGENNVAVPTHLFKIIACQSNTSPNEYGVTGFVMENEPIIDTKPLQSYQVPLEFIEKQAGLQFNNMGIASYDLCMNGYCDDEANIDKELVDRIDSWRLLGILKAAPSLSLLETTWTSYKQDEQQQQQPKWLQRMYEHEYLQRFETLSKETRTTTTTTTTHPRINIVHDDDNNNIDINIKW